MARHPNDTRDYVGAVLKRNELRREACLPLLDVEAETARLRRLDLGAAYVNFFAHLMVPHNVEWNKAWLCSTSPDVEPSLAFLG